MSSRDDAQDLLVAIGAAPLSPLLPAADEVAKTLSLMEQVMNTEEYLRLEQDRIRGLIDGRQFDEGYKRVFAAFAAAHPA